MATLSSPIAKKPYTTFDDYVIYSTFQSMTPELCKKVMDLWERNNALPPNIDPAQRARQVAMMTFRKSGELAGVSTIYENTLETSGLAVPPHEKHYFYRMFIQPADRVPELMRVMVSATYDILKAHQCPDKPKSFVIVNENPKLMRPGILKKYRQAGYLPIGKNRMGHEIVQRLF